MGERTTETTMLNRYLNLGDMDGKGDALSPMITMSVRDQHPGRLDHSMHNLTHPETIATYQDLGLPQCNHMPSNGLHLGGHNNRER
uniref:Uncharacterized protein n=1 Tax=Cannabis sativa TaxID=3483 RepID=A0A803PQV6_CANSA